jgi:hypothetical protein
MAFDVIEMEKKTFHAIFIKSEYINAFIKNEKIFILNLYTFTAVSNQILNTKRNNKREC